MSFTVPWWQLKELGKGSFGRAGIHKGVTHSRKALFFASCFFFVPHLSYSGKTVTIFQYYFQNWCNFITSWNGHVILVLAEFLIRCVYTLQGANSKTNALCWLQWILFLHAVISASCSQLRELISCYLVVFWEQMKSCFAFHFVCFCFHFCEANTL